MTCTRCGAAYLPADPECPRCGLPLTPSVSALPPSPPRVGTTAPGGPKRSWIAFGGGAFVVLLCAVVALNWFGREDSNDSRDPIGAIGEPGPGELSTTQLPPARPPTSSSSNAPGGTPSAGDNLAATAAITVDDTAEPGQDGEGRTITYGADHLVDGDLTTAWRAEGYYSDKTITFELAEKSQIQVVGLTNGYTKKDAATGEDRYEIERRITSVTWSFDNGKSVHQDLEDGVRTVQRIRIDPVEATKVTLRVDATTTPGHANSDFTAITEVVIASAP